ncbi:hypothetical protein DRO66_05135 [Candidatus Bathyarchaeota archaeon]|nr:MAG: hypothetical protein DRO66_05135 [Candidatus Bathyarchaeota archaeon]
MCELKTEECYESVLPACSYYFYKSPVAHLIWEHPEELRNDFILAFVRRGHSKRYKTGKAKVKTYLTMLVERFVIDAVRKHSRQQQLKLRQKDRISNRHKRDNVSFVRTVNEVLSHLSEDVVGGAGSAEIKIGSLTQEVHFSERGMFSLFFAGKTRTEVSRIFQQDFTSVDRIYQSAIIRLQGIFGNILDMEMFNG